MKREVRQILMCVLAFSAAWASPADADELRARAAEQVRNSTRSEDPFLRANAMEAFQHLPREAPEHLARALDDPHPAVRFAALATVGRLQVRSLAERVRELRQDSDASVQAAALFALRRCGEPVDISPMADLLSSQDPSVRANTAMLLGLLGERSAAPMLQDLARAPLRRASAVQATLARLQSAEAMVRLGDESGLGALRSAAYSQFDEVRVLAVLMVGRLRDRAMEPALQKMLRERPLELQLAAAAALAQLGRFEGLQVALGAADGSLPTLRAQAAITLGLFRQDRAQTALRRLMEDGSEQVRLSAATAVLGASGR